MKAGGGVRLLQRLDAYEKLMRLDKPIGILLLLWPTLWGVWFAAGGCPAWLVLFVFVLGTVLMRSAGCVINDWADQQFDRYVTRTRARPLVLGTVSNTEAIVLFVLLVASALTLLLLIATPLLLLLSSVALLLAISYPFTKRCLALPQAYLGLAFGFGIPMAYAAQLGHVPATAWWLLLANLFWVVAYDTEYAMVDRQDDLKIGIRTSAITFGAYDVLAVAICYAGALAILAWVGHGLAMGTFFYLGLLLAALLASYHVYMIRQREPAACFKAFLHNNWLGAAIFAGIVCDFAQRFGTSCFLGYY
ncbi:MAG: 4-hydroxybenzoate octaprenyltransferase [Pseudomonadota bacterium]